MKVAIFGASGATGRLLTERLLAAGHTVKALVREPGKFSFAGRVEVVAGSSKDAVAVSDTVRGSELVMSALGARSLKKEDILEDSVPLIVAAMRAQGVRRVIALGSAGALPDSLDKQQGWRRWMVENILYKTVLKWPVASQVAQYKILSSSGLDWTMVMPPMLTNGEGRGLERIRVDGEALPPDANRIARADVADFMMAQIGSEEWVGKGVYISW